MFYFISFILDLVSIMNKITSHFFYFFNFTYPARVPLDLNKQLNFFSIVSSSVARGVIRSSEGKVWYTAYSEERTGQEHMYMRYDLRICEASEEIWWKK